jgi:hypothetical protein
LEYFGDKRAKIIRSDTDDLFPAYSPVKLRCNFHHCISYLAKELDQSLDDIPIGSKTKQQDKDFEEGSKFNPYFSSNRPLYFYSPFNDSDLLLGKSKDTDKSFKKYDLDSDQNILPYTNLIDQIQLDFKKHGYKDDNRIEDDAKFN